MNSPITFVIFMFVLFLYIHINNQYKTSQDLEIYELEYNGIKNLQETCDVRQPVVFNFEPVIHNYAPINLDILSSIEKENGNTLNIKDTLEYFNVSENNIINPTEVPLSFHNTIQLINSDNSNTPHFFTENNHDFIEETGLDGVMIKIGDRFLKPNYTVNQTFDIMTASKGVGLPMRYHTNTRKYIYVSTGRIVVKMAPFKYVKKLEFNEKYLSSPMNCWVPQPAYTPFINKVRFIEFDVLKGHMLYIPPYWIYSILYHEDNTCLLEYNYQTFINIMAHPKEVIHSLKNVFYSIKDSLQKNDNNIQDESSEDGGEYHEKESENGEKDEEQRVEGVDEQRGRDDERQERQQQRKERQQIQQDRLNI